MKSPIEIKRALMNIRLEITQMPEGDLRYADDGEPRVGWRGADVIVTDDFEVQPGWMEQHKLWVRTRHAPALGWLFRQVRDAFRGWYDFRIKYGFFGSLGQAALKQLAHSQPESEDHRPLLLAVLAQAEVWAEFLTQHGFLPDNAPVVLHLTDQEGCQTRIDMTTGEETV